VLVVKFKVQSLIGKNYFHSVISRDLTMKKNRCKSSLHLPTMCVKLLNWKSTIFYPRSKREDRKVYSMVLGSESSA
jgi:hypothetical protein